MATFDLANLNKLLYGPTTSVFECGHVEHNKEPFHREALTRPLETLERSCLFVQANTWILVGESKADDLWIPKKHKFKSTQLQELFNNYSYPKDPIIEAIPYAARKYKEYLSKKKYSDLQEAANLGHGKAQHEMFVVLFKKQKKVVQEGLDYLHCSAAQGFSDALLKLSEVYNGEYWGEVHKDVSIAKLLCQAAADEGSAEAQFKLEVETLTRGLFNSKIDFQAGIRKAKEMQKNEFAHQLISAIMDMPGDSIREVYPVTSDDLTFLVDFLQWERDIDS